MPVGRTMPRRGVRPPPVTPPSYPLFTLADLGAARIAQWDATSGVAVTGSNVTSWTDSVGGLVVSQATTAAQPIYSATSFFGGPGINHDGVAQFLEGASLGALPVGANPCEIWALVDQQAVDAASHRLFGYGGPTLQTARTLTRDGNNNAAINYGDGTTATALPITGAVFSGRHVVRAQFNGTSTATFDGGASAIGAAVTLGTGTTRIRIGSHTLTTAAQFWQGGIACILVTQPLTTVQANQLTDYFKRRGGII